MIVKDGRECLGEMLDTFFCAKTADVADEVRAVRMWGCDGKDGKVEEVLAGDEDFVAVGCEVPFGDEGGRVDNDTIA